MNNDDLNSTLKTTCKSHAEERAERNKLFKGNTEKLNNEDSYSRQQPKR